MVRLLKRAFSDGPILAILMITLTALLTYGLSIPRLGYYHDDWYMLWSGASRGADSLISLFSMDRPFMGVIYSFFYRLIRDSIPGWHLFSLFWRILGGIAFYWILTIVFPKLKRISVFAAMLFVVFPGFLAEPNAATKVNHLVGYAAALFSIAFTLQTVKTGRRGWQYACTAISMLLMALYLWIYEYMLGLEVMRLSLLFWLQWQGSREARFPALKKVLRAYIPYVLVMGLFLFWRGFIFESTRDATDLKGLVFEYRADFVNMSLRLVFQVIKDFLSTTIFAWFVQPYHLLDGAGYAPIWSAFLAACAMVLLAAGYLRAIRKSGEFDQDNPSPFVLVVLGALISLGAVIPVVLSNRHLDLMDAYKGYGLHPSAGVMILVIGLVMMLKPKFRSIAWITLLGLSVATQTMNIQRWADYWQLQRNFWWQLTWRAPDIRDDTLLMGYLPDGYVFQQDYEIWGPANLIYRQAPLSVPRIQSEVLNQGTLTDVLAGRVTDPYVRDIFLQRNFGNLLLVSQPTTSACIHVIDGALPAYSAAERLIVQKAGEFSDIRRIDPGGATPVPPAAIFGQEPERGWCYYYQQAALSRQRGDWRRIGEIYESVQAAGLKPGDASEYFVFIEGLVNLGREDEAAAMASTIQENDALQYSLCQSLTPALDYPLSYGYRQDRIREMVCQPSND